MKRVLIALAAVLLALAGCSSSGSTSGSTSSKSELNPGQGGGTFDGAGLTPAQPRPSFSLTGTDGKQVSFAQLTAKHPTLLYFGYTNCPDVCPTTLKDVELALGKVPADVAKQTYVVFVSTDVKHDTGPVISTWLKNFSPDTRAHWVGLRGTQAQVDAAQAAAHVTLASDGGATHSAQLLLYGPDDYAHVFFLESNTEQNTIAHDLPLVAKGETGP